MKLNWNREKGEVAQFHNSINTNYVNKPEDDDEGVGGRGGGGETGGTSN